MAGIDEIIALRLEAEACKLDNRAILDKYTDEDLALIYNGIGPDAFPDWLRGAVSSLHPSLRPVAFIHDVEWHESDGSKAKFTESNDRFKSNGALMAKSNYGWYNPLRYIVMNQARRFGNICQRLGWNGWKSPCQCGYCTKGKQEEEAKKDDTEKTE